MTTTLRQPLVTVRDNADALQLSYQLPHRVHVARSYPILAPNGSAIIIYGYENGLKVLWRGGRRFGPLRRSEPRRGAARPAEKAVSGNDDTIMIIDSDEEEERASKSPASAAAEDLVRRYEFEADEPEADPARPFEEILGEVDIPLGSSRVLELAVPRVLPEAQRVQLHDFPAVLNAMIVVAAVCADCSTRVIALPLVPPHPEQTDSSALGIQVVTVGTPGSDQNIPKGVSIAFTTCDDKSAGRRPSSSSSSVAAARARTSAGGDAESSSSSQWIVVATHSAAVSGQLLVYRVPILAANPNGKGQRASFILSEDRAWAPVQRWLLPAPANKIAFNPSLSPSSSRHLNLLVSFTSGCVKVYSCRPENGAALADDTDGRWLITLYPEFEHTDSVYARRKAILDAEWVLDGRAIMVLMGDGEWGVWDVDGAGPGSVQGPLQRQGSIQGVTGGSLTAFSVRGRLIGPLLGGKSGERVQADRAENRPRPKFAPMTPSTRRIREEGLLRGSSGLPPPPTTTTMAASWSSFIPGNKQLVSVRGDISVFQTNSPSALSSRDALPDESILLRYGNQSSIIPSLLALWRNAVKATGTFDASSRCKVTPIQDVNLMGEHVRGISHLPTSAKCRPQHLHRHRLDHEQSGREFDILLVAEHRLIILAPRLVEADAARLATSAAAAATTTTAAVISPSAESDQKRLFRGDLDVEGMDRVLSSMAAASRASGSPIKRTRIFT